MLDNQRIEDLRRRIQKDPASIAFAQLAEECRRAGHFEEAIETCRAGLAKHPGYLSARVTLGRALLELNQLDDALVELQLVLKSAPENLSAIRGVAEIHHRSGHLAEALDQYRAALAIARNDPDLERTVDELAREVQPFAAPVDANGLSLEQMEQELSSVRLRRLESLQRLRRHKVRRRRSCPSPRPRRPSQPSNPRCRLRLSPHQSGIVRFEPAAANHVESFSTNASPIVREADPDESEERLLAERTVAALEAFAAAAHVSRAQRHA